MAKRRLALVRRRFPGDDAPDNPERWGAYIFAPFDSTAITSEAVAAPVQRTPLASVLEVSSDRDQTAVLQLDRETEVSIEALLEADSDGRWYDTATLTHVGDGRGGVERRACRS